MRDDPQEKISAGSDEGFLSRWSRRKQATSRELEEEDLPQHAEQSLVDDAFLNGDDVIPAGDEASLLTDEDMPPLESLGEDSDYSAFMSPKVSDELRRMALRKLFHGSSFNIVDGLNDYDDDFSNFEKLGNIITSDMKFHAEQEKLKQDREALQAETETAIEDEETVDAEPEEEAVVAVDKTDAGQTAADAPVTSPTEQLARNVVSADDDEFHEQHIETDEENPQDEYTS